MIPPAKKIRQNKFSRLLSLDVFRGLTIALMILVNSPGNQTAYTWLEHSAWNGCTIADLVFPFFIFIVGVSSVFSLSKAREVNHMPLPQLLIKIIKRSLIIFLIGLLLNAFPNHFEMSTLRFYGVLQRIAICYFVASILFLTTKIEIQVLIIGILLIGYWLILILANVPGFGVGNLTLEGNFAAYVDRVIFSSAHLYGKFYDPEGLLSTIPAIATALLGNISGAWLLSKYDHWQKLKGLITFGIMALIVGWLWSIWFPINKILWSSSYVLWTGGWALIVLAFCYWLIEIQKWKSWSKPFEIFGANALAVYFLHVFFLKLQIVIMIHCANGVSENLKLFVTNRLFGWASPENASLFYALSYTLFWLLILSILYRKKIFIKI
ncbi:acyltransferase family protein [Legionella micdadei]|uniref:Heparan-alpha-glucosaminide N-acetyltransferase n=2 Tax=Legionella micdadei TaxID=451 RepID=A0A098GF91_LEGMI|nr:heparan-alpha-glucosaminide N-acetyltransferase domain-containing protein [Legionella micdadei]KTD28264.1 putative Heparan-alpha-glucosaminide N-acetyltransferase [Legionella micdadei]NSL16892.1 DUF1624 domain-containing protein [Legionella micdadei]CEG61149.1 Heparan-alpha-glucosaminide N-acetyltransferase [Legionella micdadei]SCY31516.1 Predicted acyltransferase [Legionella micdadei]